MKYVFNFFVVGCLLLFGCEVVELDSPVAGDTSNDLIGSSTIEVKDSMDFIMLMSGTEEKNWLTSEFTLAGSNNLTACRLDDQMILHRNGTYQYNGGSRLCGAEDNKRERVGSWELSYSSNTLTFDKGTSMEYKAEVIGLNNGEIRLKGSYFNLEVRGLYKLN